MTPIDLVLCLLGNKRAILKCSSCRTTLSVGVVIVLNSGLALTCNRVYIPDSIWVLFVPLIASFAVAAIVTASGRRLRLERQPSPAVMRESTRFIGLIWVSFGIMCIGFFPYELFFSKYTSERLVPISWRTGLFIQLIITIRFVCVIYGRSVFEATIAIVPYLSLALLLAKLLPPHRDWFLHGEVRRSVLEYGIWFCDTIVAVCAFISISLVFVHRSFSKRQYVAHGSFHLLEKTTFGHGFFTTGLLLTCSLCFWCIVIPKTQTQQHLKAVVEEKFVSNDIQSALLLMDSQSEHDFPLLWDPPPKLTQKNPYPDVLSIVDAVIVLDIRSWVRKKYINKFEQYIGSHTRFYPDVYFRSDIRPIDLFHTTVLLERLPEGGQIASYYSPLIEFLLSERGAELSVTERHLLSKWVSLARKK